MSKETMEETIHTLPINDSKSHREVGLMCECKPTVEVVNSNFVVTHHSYDGRESKEKRQEIILPSNSIQ